MSKCNYGLKTSLQEGLSEPKFYGDLVYKFKEIVGKTDISEQFKRIFTRYQKIGYSMGVLQQTA